MPNRARTRLLLGVLRSVGRVARRRRLPRQQQPDAIRLAYAQALVPLMDAARDAVREVEAEIFAGLRARRALLAARLDAPPPPPDFGTGSGPLPGDPRRWVDEAARRFAEKLRPVALEDIARRIGKRTADHQRDELDRQVRAAVGVPLSALQADVPEKLQTWAVENVALIKTVPERYFERLRRDVAQAYADGTAPETLARQLADAYEIGLGDARRIARDQVGKLNGQLNEDRQKALGVTGYVWRTMNDNRVRDEHVDREGQGFQWADAPEDGHPGEAIQCFPGDTPARLLGAHVLKAYRRRYRGQLSTLVADTGEVLRATVNHPVLTARGWLPAHAVDVGDQVFHAPAQRFDTAVGDPQRRDSTLAEIFGALAELVDAHRVAGGASGFHGDGTDEQVDVVDVDRGLRLELDSTLTQGFCNDVLALADDPALGLRHAHLALLGNRRAPNGVVRGASQLLALLGGEGAHPLQHGGRAVARLDAIAKKLSANGRARDAEALRDLLHAHPVGVEPRHHVARVVLGIWARAIDAAPGLDAPSAEELAQVVTLAADGAGSLRDRLPLLQSPRRIVEKRVGEPYVGHVFNLETSTGWYVATNLIVRNCRCYAEPDFSGLLG